MIKQVGDGNLTDLEAFAQLADYGASLTPNCSQCFVNNMGAVLTGDTGNLAWVNEVLGQMDSSNWDNYYDPSQQLGQSGFASIFQDPGAGGSQPHHYWFYVQMGFQQSMLKNNPAAIFPYMAVIAHETIITRNAAGNSY